MTFIKFIFSSFWIWLGALIMLGVIVDAPIKIASRLTRRSMVIKKGWPPAHLDADGDWKKEPEKEKNSVNIKI